MSGAKAPGGGSPAAKAYREQLAREGTILDPLPAPPTAAPPVAPSSVSPGAVAPVSTPAANTKEARAAERRKITGRARVVVGGSEVMGKMVDISLTGVCILMEDMFPGKKMCTLECSIFVNGESQYFSVPAVSIYGVLVRGKGFNIGFQFGPRAAAAAKVIGALLA